MDEVAYFEFGSIIVGINQTVASPVRYIADHIRSSGLKLKMARTVGIGAVEWNEMPAVVVGTLHVAGP